MAMSLPLLDGDFVVKITGLQNKVDLNGEYAVIRSQRADGKLKVQLLKTRINLFINPENTITVEIAEKKAARKRFLVINRSKAPYFHFPQNYFVFVNSSTLKIFPMGNSLATVLVENIPIDTLRVSILLLGCGDSRHILFTCSNNLLLNQGQISLLLDVTMCDMERSFHARNIILFKMIIDHIKINKIWCLYYATSIDDICLALLQTYASDLYNIGEKVQAWHASNNGSIIKFSDQRSYNSVREIWKLYAKGKISNTKEIEVKQRQKILCENFNDLTSTTPFLRSCNPTSLSSSSNVELHRQIFKQYHEIGITPTCIYNPPDADNNNHYINPMFLRGQSQNYNLDFCQHPILGFHLSHAYIKIESNSTSTAHSTISEDDIYKICFDQFQDWCNGFKEHVNQSKIIIRVFTGDAYDLCHLLSDEGRQ
eukprot:gene10010-20833_t